MKLQGVNAGWVDPAGLVGDFTRYVHADTLITHPPSSLAGDLRPIARINTVIDIAETLLGRPRS